MYDCLGVVELDDDKALQFALVILSPGVGIPFPAGVALPIVGVDPNFQDIGYISFDADQLDAKVNDLLKELIAFKILKVSVGD